MTAWIDVAEKARWLVAVTQHPRFRDFLAFFFPQAHAGIDWSAGYTLLDKELQKVVRDAK